MRRLRGSVWIAAVMSTAAAGALALAAPAAASTVYKVYGTGGIGLSVRSAPTTSSTRIATLPEGTSVAISCQTIGETIYGSAIWDKLDSAGYVSDWYVNTPNVGTFSPGLSVCASSAIGSYNRGAAAQWAVAHAYDAPEYVDADCTNFVSNAMSLGGGLQPTAWWYHNSYSVHSFSWTVAKDFAYQMYQHGYVTRQDIDASQRYIPDAWIGDVILYDQGDGNGFNHVAIIVQISTNGTVMVAEHTAAYANRVWNQAWTESPNRSAFHAQLLHVRT
jgi:hypothetical protein